MPHRTARFAATALLFAVTAVTAGSAVAATEPGQGYRLPPEPLAAILDAPPTPQVSLAPDRTTMALLEEEAALSH